MCKNCVVRIPAKGDHLECLGVDAARNIICVQN